MKDYGYNMTPIFDETEAAQIMESNKRNIREASIKHTLVRQKLEDTLDAYSHDLSPDDIL